MGLLSQGSPLNWEETKKYADHIRKHGIIQFLNIYNKVKERQKDVLKWGDEVRNGPRSSLNCASVRKNAALLMLARVARNALDVADIGVCMTQQEPFIDRDTTN